MAPLFVSALLVSILPVIAALFLPNYYLGDTQNAVDGVGKDGTKKPLPALLHQQGGEGDNDDSVHTVSGDGSGAWDDEDDEGRGEGPSEETTRLRR